MVVVFVCPTVPFLCAVLGILSVLDLSGFLGFGGEEPQATDIVFIPNGLLLIIVANTTEPGAVNIEPIQENKSWKILGDLLA